MTKTYGVGCMHSDFTCAAACETKPAWDKELTAAGLNAETVAAASVNSDGVELGPLSKQWRKIIGRPVSSHPSSLPTAEMASLVNDLGELTTVLCDCTSQKLICGRVYV